MQKDHCQFCIECRKNTNYITKKIQRSYFIRGKEYIFDTEAAICECCGEEINLPGLMDKNAKLIDKQYREVEGLVSIDDINSLMTLYNIGKAPLSLALGFGEITITRYILGQYPSPEYSEVIRNALNNPKYMLDLLNQNREKIGEVAYKKSRIAAESLINLLDSLSEKILFTISYILKEAEDITPLQLQKLLYYTQAIYMVNYNKTLFPEKCQAWEFGPVYKNVYDVFKEFKYNPIEDKRFIFFKNNHQSLSENDKHIIDMVINTFGMYSGKTLTSLTHRESPWNEVYDDTVNFHSEVITNESIKKYFVRMAKNFNFSTEEGINSYITELLAMKTEEVF